MKKNSKNTERQKKEKQSNESMEMPDVSKEDGTEKPLDMEAVEKNGEKTAGVNVESEKKHSVNEGPESEQVNPTNGRSESGQADPANEEEKSEKEVIADEDEEEEKLLFRDTTPELVSAAVRSLNQQGLASVQYREEEGTYAVYASPEEFERARELLIEILKDEADSIRERARTLEAKKTLRIMETTELAPGFRPEKTPKEKYEDANSTAIAFLLVGACGLLFLLLEYFGIFFSLGLSGTVRYIFYPTMLVMFGAFLAVGFVSMNSAAKWKVKMFEETKIMNNVREYVEHDLIHEIRALMAERVVREAEEVEMNAATVAQPNPEDALLQLTNLIEGGFPGEETLEEAEEAVRQAPAGLATGVPSGFVAVDEFEMMVPDKDGETNPAEGTVQDEDKNPAEGTLRDEKMNPAEGTAQDKDKNLAEGAERDEDMNPVEKSARNMEENLNKAISLDEKADSGEEFDPPEESYLSEVLDTSEISEPDEMENAFNDYYAMEHEIQLRLLKEFPDLPANLLMEATEYVIKLVEETFEDEENAPGNDNADSDDADGAEDMDADSGDTDGTGTKNVDVNGANHVRS